ncbi:MAG: protein translocase subunit SecF [Gemmatimonadales bacterium]
MIRFFANANYDFIGVRRYAYGVTATLFALSVVALIVWGFNYSIEFTGGTLVRVQTAETVDVAALRTAIVDQGIRGPEITTIGSAGGYLIKARTAKAGADADNTQVTAAAVGVALDQVIGAGKYTPQGSGAVGPKVASELQGKALSAILLSFLAVLAYLAVRFEWRFGLAAVAATAHDIILTIGFIALMRLEVSLVVVGAVLSMVGYSLNDTIIIFDRIRENLHKYKRDHFIDIINRSINETLPRSVLTHGTTLATLTSLAIFGGEVIRPFALVMFFGVFTGTFSSIYIAGPVLIWIEQKWPGAEARGVKTGAKVANQPSALSRPPAAVKADV